MRGWKNKKDLIGGEGVRNKLVGLSRSALKSRIIYSYEVPYVYKSGKNGCENVSSTTTLPIDKKIFSKYLFRACCGKFFLQNYCEEGPNTLRCKINASTPLIKYSIFSNPKRLSGVPVHYCQEN